MTENAENPRKNESSDARGDIRETGNDTSIDKTITLDAGEVATQLIHARRDIRDGHSNLNFGFKVSNGKVRHDGDGGFNHLTVGIRQIMREVESPTLVSTVEMTEDEVDFMHGMVAEELHGQELIATATKSDIAGSTEKTVRIKIIDPLTEIEEAEEGDVLLSTRPRSEGSLGYNPNDLTQKLASRMGKRVDKIRESGRKGDMGLKYYFIFIDDRIVIGVYGHNDQDVDRGFRVKQVGRHIRAEYAGGFDTDRFDAEYTDGEKEKLEELTIEALNEAGYVVAEQIHDHGVMDINSSTITFNSPEPLNWIQGDELDKYVEELAERYFDEENRIKTDLLSAVRGWGNGEFTYRVELVD